MRSKINFLLFLYSLMQLGYVFSFGNFSTPGIYILLGAFLLWLLFNFKLKFFEKNFNFSPTFLLYLILIFSVILSLVGLDPTLQQPGILQRPDNFLQLVWLMRITLVLALFISLFFFQFKNRSLIFFLLVTSSAIIQISIIIVSPNPRIDTFDILKLGSLGLAQGLNPYQMTFLPIYPGVNPDYFSYTPGILLVTIPAVYLLTDHRLLFALANVATAIIWYLLMKKKVIKDRSLKNIPELLPAIFLFNPVTSFIVLRGWSDPIVIFLFTLIVFLVIVKKWDQIALIILGVIITIKQTMLPVPIFFMRWLRGKRFGLLTIFATALLITLPFFFWAPSDFLKDVIFFHLKNPVRHDSLAINTLFFQLTGVDIPDFILLAIWFLSAFFILRYQKNNLDDAFSAMSFWFLVFFLFNNKQAFVNYYYFISSLVLLQLICMIGINNSNLKRKGNENSKVGNTSLF